ncbi:hypothetical protein HN446_01810 [bacterium]|jgi:hypothetical protein|nr:hypothetical protein [bacterium]
MKIKTFFMVFCCCAFLLVGCKQKKESNDDLSRTSVEVQAIDIEPEVSEPVGGRQEGVSTDLPEPEAASLDVPGGDDGTVANGDGETVQFNLNQDLEGDGTQVDTDGENDENHHHHHNNKEPLEGVAPDAEPSLPSKTLTTQVETIARTEQKVKTSFFKRLSAAMWENTFEEIVNSLLVLFFSSMDMLWTKSSQDNAKRAFKQYNNRRAAKKGSFIDSENPEINENIIAAMASQDSTRTDDGSVLQTYKAGSLWEPKSTSKEVPAEKTFEYLQNLMSIQLEYLQISLAVQKDPSLLLDKNQKETFNGMTKLISDLYISIISRDMNALKCLQNVPGEIHWKERLDNVNEYFKSASDSIIGQTTRSLRSRPAKV